MNLILYRKYLRPTYTIGKLFIDGSYFCDTLEDKVRDLPNEPKVPGQTAIPSGRYTVIMDFSVRFQRIMPHIINVPYFTGIRIHGGNTDADTEGCPLVGRNTFVGGLTESRDYSNKLNNILSSAKDTIFIDIL